MDWQGIIKKGSLGYPFMFMKITLHNIIMLPHMHNVVYAWAAFLSEENQVRFMSSGCLLSSYCCKIKGRRAICYEISLRGKA